MSEAKEKDRILEEIKAFKKPNEIAGLSKHLNDLERNGHVSVWRDEQGGLISVRITQSGKDFLDGGKCRKTTQKPKRLTARLRLFRRDLWGLILAIFAAVIATYLSKILGWI